MVKTNFSELWKLIKGQQQSENPYSKSTCPSPTSNSRLPMYQTLFKGPSQKTQRRPQTQEQHTFSSPLLSPPLPPSWALSKDPDHITCHPGAIPEEARVHLDHPGFGLSAHPLPPSSSLHQNRVVAPSVTTSQWLPKIKAKSVHQAWWALAKLAWRFPVHPFLLQWCELHRKGRDLGVTWPGWSDTYYHRDLGCQQLRRPGSLLWANSVQAGEMSMILLHCLTRLVPFIIWSYRRGTLRLLTPGYPQLFGRTSVWRTLSSLETPKWLGRLGGLG